MRLKKEYILRSIAGQDVIVATGEAAMKYNGLLTVTPVGKFILEHYEKSESLSDLVDQILHEFDVDRATAAEDAEGFTQAMLEHGFIEIDDPEKGW